MIHSINNLLKELSLFYKFTLTPNHDNTYLLMVNGMPIFIYPDRNRDEFYFISKLCEIAPGNFQTQALEKILKQNGIPPYKSIFGFNPEKNEVTLSERVELQNVDGPKICSIFGEFSQKGILWKKELEMGRFPATND